MKQSQINRIIPSSYCHPTHHSSALQRRIFTPAVMLNHLHLWHCGTTPIKAAGFNSVNMLQVRNMWLSKLLSIQKPIRIQRKQYVLIIYCKMYLSSKMKQVTPESSNEGAVGKLNKYSQDRYSQVRLSLGNGTVCLLLNK